MSNQKEGLTLEFKGKPGDIFRRLDNTGYVEVGIIGSSEKTDDGDVTVAYYGSVHEFGYPPLNIPERSFLRKPLKVFMRRYMYKNCEKIIASFFRGEKEKILHKLGIAAKNAVIKSFKTRGVYGEWPDLSDETIARKGVDTPLIDTGALRQSLDYRVTLKEEIGK